MSTKAYPLSWPKGWARSVKRTDALFRVGGGKAGQSGGRRLELDDGVDRVYDELVKLGVKEPAVLISSNVQPTIGSRSGRIAVSDPGVAVYWTDKRGQPRCMAIDRYLRVPDNLGAIAATLEAMRTIERHGGAEILDRAFTGFTSLPGPTDAPWDVLGIAQTATKQEIDAAYRDLARQAHPDRPGGSHDAMQRVNLARDAMYLRVGA